MTVGVRAGAAFPPIELRGLQLDWSRPYVMGVLNLTPDSFSDGGRLASLDAAVARAEALVAAGADLLDVGGEATNPRALPVTQEEEEARVLPALAAGAEIVNDISGGLFDPRMAAVVAAHGAVYVVGHLRGSRLGEVFGREGSPPTAAEVADELEARLATLPPAVRARCIVDPGLGFGKGAGQVNLELTRRAGELGARLGRPVLVGPSRKRFVAALARRTSGAGLGAAGAAALPLSEAALDAATIGACLAAVAGGAHMLRVHNVELLCPALLVYEAMMKWGP